MLTDAECRNAICPTGKEAGAVGLIPAGCIWKSARQVQSAGSGNTAKTAKKAAWRWAAIPTLALTAARKARDAAKLQKSEGRDPVQVRKIEKLKATTPASQTPSRRRRWNGMK